MELMGGVDVHAVVSQLPRRRTRSHCPHCRHHNPRITCTFTVMHCCIELRGCSNQDLHSYGGMSARALPALQTSQPTHNTHVRSNALSFAVALPRTFLRRHVCEDNASAAVPSRCSLDWVAILPILHPFDPTTTL